MSADYLLGLNECDYKQKDRDDDTLDRIIEKTKSGEIEWKKISAITRLKDIPDLNFAYNDLYKTHVAVYESIYNNYNLIFCHENNRKQNYTLYIYIYITTINI